MKTQLNIKNESPINLINYNENLDQLPSSGKHIVGYQSEENIIVYQAYKPSIAKYAVSNQEFGGNDFSYNRMSWIKPGFMWMMYRSGWGEKENQERILAISISKLFFKKILENAALSSFNPEFHRDEEEWKNSLSGNEVRLQWDPDHDPFGNKMERRAIQLGLKGKILHEFGKEQINYIEDITDFVKSLKSKVDNKLINDLIVPQESVFQIEDEILNHKIGLK